MTRSVLNTRNLLTPKLFLRVAERARKVKGIKLNSIEYVDNEIIFKCDSVSRKGVVWTQHIKVVDLADHKYLEKLKKGPEEGQRDLIKSYRKAARANAKSPLEGKSLQKALIDSPIRVHCDCEAFLFWGYQYIAWKKGYGLVVEHRRPRVRNPHQQGYICKHLYAVLSIYPMLTSTIARKLKTNDKELTLPK